MLRGWPFFDFLSYAIILTLWCRLVVRGSVEWMKNNSKLMMKVVSCKIRSDDSSKPAGSIGHAVFNELWRKPAIFYSKNRRLMHRIRLGIAVFVSKWTASEVGVGSLNGCGIGNRMNRREARLLRTRCRKGRVTTYCVCLITLCVA